MVQEDQLCLNALAAASDACDYSSYIITVRMLL